jgi:hypothetical protein
MWAAEVACGTLSDNDTSKARTISIPRAISIWIKYIRLEAGGWRLEAGGWRLKAGGWRLEAGGWRLDNPNRNRNRNRNRKETLDAGNGCRSHSLAYVLNSYHD